LVYLIYLLSIGYPQISNRYLLGSAIRKLRIVDIGSLSISASCGADYSISKDIADPAAA